MDIRDLDSGQKMEFRSPLPKPSIIHEKGEKRFIVDTNYLPLLYLTFFLYFFVVLVICLRWISGWVFVFFIPVWFITLFVFCAGYRYEFNEAEIICRRLKRGFISGQNIDIKDRGGLELKRFDPETVSQAGLIRGKRTVYIRVAFSGCKPFTEPWIWLHLLRNMGKVLILRIRKAEAERAEALIKNYFFEENLPVFDECVEKKQSKPTLASQKAAAADNNWICFLLIYMAISLAAIPLFGFVFNQSNGSVLTIYGILSLACFALFFLAPSRRRRMVAAIKRLFSRSTYRELSTVRKCLLGLLCLLVAVLTGISLYCMHQTDIAGGVPSIYQGVYCIWNHRFIREITLEEYRFLCLMQNLNYTCVRALFPTGLLLLEIIL